MLHFHKYEFTRTSDYVFDGDSGRYYTEVIFTCKKCLKVKAELFKGRLIESDFNHANTN